MTAECEGVGRQQETVRSVCRGGSGRWPRWVAGGRVEVQTTAAASRDKHAQA